VKPQSDQRFSDHVALGVLTRTFPLALVEAAGKLEQRHRLLPARLVVYYVLALALFSDSGYEEVMRNLVEGLATSRGGGVTGTSRPRGRSPKHVLGLAQARSRRASRRLACRWPLRRLSTLERQVRQLSLC